MISVRCPACGKVIGFEEADAGSLVACPICRQVFFVPVIAQPVNPGDESAPPVTRPTDPPVAPRLPLEPTLPDLDDIRIAADPDLDPIPEQYDEVQLADEPPPEPPSPPEPAPPPAPDPIPHLELDPPEEIETVEPVGTPAEVEPTDVATSLSAAEELSQSLPEKKDPDRPADVLEEVDEEEDDRFELKEEQKEPDEEEDEEEERRKRRKSKRGKSEHRKPYHAQPPRPEGVTRNRIMGGVGTGMGGMILMGTLLHHLTASRNAWHYGVCCADVFALAMVGVGLYFLIKG